MNAYTLQYMSNSRCSTMGYSVLAESKDEAISKVKKDLAAYMEQERLSGFKDIKDDWYLYDCSQVTETAKLIYCDY